MFRMMMFWRDQAIEKTSFIASLFLFFEFVWQTVWHSIYQSDLLCNQPRLWFIVVFSLGACKVFAVPIPKTIHYIWIGGDLPEHYAADMIRTSEMNPEYRVKLWTDSPYDSRLKSFFRN